MKWRLALAMAVAIGVVFGGRVSTAGEKEKPAPPKIEPVSAEEKQKLLDAETPEQKALRKALKASKGKIAFNANIDGTQRIYIMNPDGSDVKCLTPAPGPGGNYPHISPDGKKIVFDSSATKEIINKLPCAEGYNKNYVKDGCAYVMDIAGGERKPVAAGGGCHWSWDGKRLIYAFDTMGRRGYGKTAILDLETNKETIITPGNKMRPIHMPCFTPDNKLALVSNGDALLIWLNESYNGPAADAKSACVVRGHPCNLEVSADGKWWSWVVDTHGNYGAWLQYAEARYDGQGVRGLNLNLGWPAGSVNYFPDFSPDGKYLVYVHADQQKGVKSWELQGKQEIYAATFPECKTTVRLTWSGAGNQHPHWR
ncbi:hypothetical protein ACFL01_00815 [Planctomycetota bacterium]